MVPAPQRSRHTHRSRAGPRVRHAIHQAVQAPRQSALSSAKEISNDCRLSVTERGSDRLTSYPEARLLVPGRPWPGQHQSSIFNPGGSTSMGRRLKNTSSGATLAKRKRVCKTSSSAIPRLALAVSSLCASRTIPDEPLSGATPTHCPVKNSVISAAPPAMPGNEFTPEAERTRRSVL